MKARAKMNWSIARCVTKTMESFKIDVSSYWRKYSPDTKFCKFVHAERAFVLLRKISRNVAEPPFTIGSLKFNEKFAERFLYVYARLAFPLNVVKQSWTRLCKIYIHKKYEKGSVIVLVLVWHNVLTIVSTLSTFFEFEVRHPLWHPLWHPVKK